jgi:hypothetical protein
LLELGVPADSADCYYSVADKKNTYIRNAEETSIFSRDGFTPCWSVGRLMAIYFISKGLDYWSPQFKKYQIENSVEYFVALIEENIKELDFSKLEE